MVIGIANTKGGVGKSTISLLSAHLLSLKHPTATITVLDADPQGTCLNWAYLRTTKSNLPMPFQVKPLSSKIDFLPQIEAAVHESEIVIIDVGGSDNPNLRSTLLVADLILVPTSLESMEKTHTIDTINLIAEADENKPTYIILNNIKQTKERETQLEYSQVMPTFVTMPKPYISSRVKISRTYEDGKTIFDLTDKEREIKGEEEVAALLNEIFSNQYLRNIKK